MAIPDYQSLMRPLLECGKDGNEVRTSECVDTIADKLGLSQEDREELLPSGRQPLLFNRIHWARTYLGKAGAVESTKRGYFRLTDRGFELLNNGPERITNDTLSKFAEFNKWREANNENKEKPTPSKDNDSDASPEEMIEKAHQSINAQLETEILESLYSVTPTMFEHIIVDLLISMGYGGGRAEMGKALGQTNDGGVDGVIKEDELGLDVVYMQAKKHKLDSTISRPDIQSFVGSLEGFNATKGVFVTTGNFASTVEEYVSRIHKRIVLINGKKLAQLMIKHGVGVRTKNTYELKYIDEDYFVDG